MGPGARGHRRGNATSDPLSGPPFAHLRRPTRPAFLHPGGGRTLARHRQPPSIGRQASAADEHRRVREAVPAVAKALRLYDELGLLPPASVDPSSGYRFYEAAQLRRARLVAALRQLGVPLAEIKAIVELDPGAGAERIHAYWAAAEVEHAARRELAAYLVDSLGGKRSVMYEVSTRDIPDAACCA